MVRRFLHIILVLSVVSFITCLEPFEFESPDEVEQILVIDGLLTSSPGKKLVTLSYTKEFSKKFVEPLRGAQVTLHTPQGPISYLENPEGLYEIANFAGVEGELYHIEVVMPDGKVYESTPAAMPKAIKADRAFHEFDRDIVVSTTGVERISNVINVFVDTDIPPSENNEATYMRWFVDELFIYPEETCGPLHIPKTCYVTVPGNAQNIRVFNSLNFGSNKLENFKVATKTNMAINQFKTVLFFNVYQYVVNEDAFEYWNRVQSLTGQSGTVFDLPPASLRGNLNNVNDPEELVLGYFEVATTDTVRTKITSFEFRDNVNLTVNCSPFSRFNWPEECCNCSTFENVSFERPDWVD